MKRIHRQTLSPAIVNGSMLLYILWLLLPAVQAAGHAVTGVLAVGLFAVGVVLDGETLPKKWFDFLPRVLLAAALPLVLFLWLSRGGGNLPAYLAQQGMFWFPLLWFAYARGRGDRRLYRWVLPLFVLAIAVTTLTTIGWLTQGMLRGDKVYAYARSLGSGEAGRQDYLRELMLRNIGGYDFVYASVLLLPMVFYAAYVLRGWKRLGAILLYAAQLCMIVLSQYTYAILFAAAITAVELLALLLRAIFRKLTPGRAMLWTLPFFAALWLLRVPLITWAGNIAVGLGFENASYSLSQLLVMLNGGAVDAGSRLELYQDAVRGFAASPLLGALAGGAKALGMHSDLLDMLSALGLLGTAAFAGAAWIIGRGAETGLTRSPAIAHILLQRVFFAACLVLGTVFYSRELPLVLCISAAFTLPSTAKNAPNRSL